jgi:hypothetical protein
VHVSLSGGQVTVSRQLLDGPCSRASHREVGTERVTQNMDADVAKIGPPSIASALRRRLSSSGLACVVDDQNSRASDLLDLAARRNKSAYITRRIFVATDETSGQCVDHNQLWRSTASINLVDEPST